MENNSKAKNLAAEMIFTLFLIILVVFFYLDSLRFHPVAARAPYVSMVPLAILIIFHFISLCKIVKFNAVTAFLESIVHGKVESHKKVVLLVFYMVVFVGLMYIFGQYISSSVFIIILMGFIAREKWSVTLPIAILTPIILFLIFELALGLQLNRGILYLLWKGYTIF